MQRIFEIYYRNYAVMKYKYKMRNNDNYKTEIMLN